MFTTSMDSGARRAQSSKIACTVVASVAMTVFALTPPSAQASLRYGGPGCESTQTDDFRRYIEPGWQAVDDYPDNQQKIIIASDSQAFRYMTKRDRYEEEIESTGWKERTQVYDAIGQERQVNYYVPVLVNGDITEFGHSGERTAAQEMFQRMSGWVGGPLILPGLGNHDYQNNVDDCANNGCARDSTCGHIAWVNQIEPKNSFDYQYANSTHQGSLSYSVDVGRVHIVQLNNEPTYTRSWETGGGLSFRTKRKFEITSSMEWLENDLAQAHGRGQQIIVNLHRPDHWDDDQVRRTQFTELVNKYKVAGVFVGHEHRLTGHRYNLGSVPLFHSGALAAGSYLRVYFDWDNYRLRVEVVTMDNSDSDKLSYRLPMKSPRINQ